MMPLSKQKKSPCKKKMCRPLRTSPVYTVHHIYYNMGGSTWMPGMIKNYSVKNYRLRKTSNSTTREKASYMKRPTVTDMYEPYAPKLHKPKRKILGKPIKRTLSAPYPSWWSKFYLKSNKHRLENVPHFIKEYFRRPPKNCRRRYDYQYEPQNTKR